MKLPRGAEAVPFCLGLDAPRCRTRLIPDDAIAWPPRFAPAVRRFAFAVGRQRRATLTETGIWSFTENWLWASRSHECS